MLGSAGKTCSPPTPIDLVSDQGVTLGAQLEVGIRISQNGGEGKGGVRVYFSPTFGGGGEGGKREKRWSFELFFWARERDSGGKRVGAKYEVDKIRGGSGGWIFWAGGSVQFFATVFFSRETL